MIELSADRFRSAYPSFAEQVIDGDGHFRGIFGALSGRPVGSTAPSQAFMDVRSHRRAGVRWSTVQLVAAFLAGAVTALVTVIPLLERLIRG